MENNNSEILHLTNIVFNVLIDSLISHFRLKYNIHDIYKDSQLYGFGNYNDQDPSLKTDFELIIKSYVNGKYLYNKKREAASGKPIVKIGGDYKFLFFKYLGYKDIIDFINTDLFTSKQRNQQLDLLNKSNVIDDHYYVGYYYGEDNKMNKGQIVIHNNWKTIEMLYLYINENKGESIYTFYGNITQSEDFAYFDTKYYLGNKKSEGAKFIFFIGKSAPNERQYLIGTYSGFDKYDRAIAGKMILKKFSTKQEIEQEVKDIAFDPIICQELNKHRLVVESSIRKNPLTFSNVSPYAQVLSKSAGVYTFNFKIRENHNPLEILIERYHYNITSLNESIIIENDRISVLNKGQVLNFDFLISGMFFLQKVSIYIKTIDFIENRKDTKTNFIGVDLNNNIIFGNVLIENII